MIRLCFFIHNHGFIHIASRSIYYMKSLAHCAIVSSGDVTVCPIVRSLSKISWSLPPASALTTKPLRNTPGNHDIHIVRIAACGAQVLSPKKWIVSKCSVTYCRQNVLSQPLGKTSKEI